MSTTFTARLPGGELRLRIGARHPNLDALLDARRLLAWAYVTAHNPGSVPTDPAANDRAHETLRDALAAMGFEHYEGDGIPDTLGWSAERSVLILGIGEEEAIAVGARFGQLAIVAGVRGEPARLVRVSDSRGQTR